MIFLLPLWRVVTLLRLCLCLSHLHHIRMAVFALGTLVCWYGGLFTLMYTSAPGPSGDRGEWQWRTVVAAQTAPSRRTPDTVPFVPVQLQSMELPATTVGEWWRRHSLYCFFFNFAHQYCCRVALTCLASRAGEGKVGTASAKDPAVTSVVTSRGSGHGALR